MEQRGLAVASRKTRCRIRGDDFPGANIYYEEAISIH
jgi:hypothetical protein